jgi:flagellar biosynthesis protein FlhG
MPTATHKMQIWPIGSGKGGVGKTLMAANLGILFSRMNKKVVVLDADLGASNLHTALGVPYVRTTLNDLLTGAAQNLSDVAVDTPFPGLRLIGGSRQLPVYSDYQQKLTRKILDGIPALNADILLLDLGGGIASHVLDLFLLSNQGVVVVTNDPASIQNTYQFLKMAVYRKILKAFPNNPLISYMVHTATHPKSREKIISVPELLDKISHVDGYYSSVIRNILQPFSPRVIVNMVRDGSDNRAATVVKTVSERFVGITPELLGILEFDPGITASTLNLRPFTADPENQKASEQLTLIAHELLEMARPSGPPAADVEEKAPSPKPDPLPQEKEVWLMDNIQHENRPLYVLTEKLNRDGVIQTSIYYHGKILFSKQMQYPELLNGNTDEEALQKLVQRQHRIALKGIEKGRIAFEEDS